MATMLQCYNKGCLAKFDPENNGSDVCVHHPGAPRFHEGYKIWSCCNRKTTDFTEFLNMKGCTKGPHNAEKPPEPEKPVQPVDRNEVVEVVVGRPPPTTAARSDEKMQKLNVSTSSSLQQVLERGRPEREKENFSEGDAIAPGTVCQNSACGKTYVDESSLTEDCYFHHGAAIFHEGMKYWSCCQRKTSDFDSFLQQVGCTRGKHQWTKTQKKCSSCRYDFHQTSTDVYLTIYAKNAQPLDSYFEANPTNFVAHVEYNFGDEIFDLELPLWGAVNVDASSVTLYAAKIEMRFRKAEPFAWSKYVYIPPAPPTDATASASD